MFPFHCNKCFRRRKFDNTLDLYVSRCGHILCKECVQENCCICSRPFKSVPINKDMPQAMAEYFSNPMKQYQHYQKVMKFHHEQERRLAEHLCQSNEGELKKIREERHGYIKLQDTIKREVEHERERIRKLKEYAAYHERRLEQVRYMTPPITAQPRPRYPSRGNSVDNVTPSTSNHNNSMMQQLTQPIRAKIICPHSPTLSTNNSSITTEGTLRTKQVANTKRTPPPLLPFSQHNLLKQHFSLSSMD